MNDALQHTIFGNTVLRHRQQIEEPLAAHVLNLEGLVQSKQGQLISGGDALRHRTISTY